MRELDVLRAGAGWRRLGDWCARLADVLVHTEPFWVTGALGFTCTAVLWGLGWSWAGLVAASVAFPLRRWRLGYLTRRTPFDVPVVLVLLASLIGVAVSPERGLSAGAFQGVLACILLYYSLVNIARPPQVKAVLAVAALLVFTGALLAFREGFDPPPAFSGFGARVQGSLQHLPGAPRLSSVSHPVMTSAHGLTIALEMVLLPVVGLVLFAPGLRWKGAALAAGLPFLGLLLLFGSQGAWLALLVGTALLLVWRSRWAGLPIAAVAGLGYLGYRQGWFDPGPLFTQYGPSHSLAARVELWIRAADVIRHHPVAGCGLGCLGRYSTTALLSPHNAYLQLYADMGMVGGVAFLATLIIGARMAVRLVKAPRNGAWYGLAAGTVAAAAAVAVHGLFEGSPAGIIAETSGGYRYILSPVVAILAGFLVRAQEQ